MTRIARYGVVSNEGNGRIGGRYGSATMTATVAVNIDGIISDANMDILYAKVGDEHMDFNNLLLDCVVCYTYDESVGNNGDWDLVRDNEDEVLTVVNNALGEMVREGHLTESESAEAYVAIKAKLDDIDNYEYELND